LNAYRIHKDYLVLLIAFVSATISIITESEPLSDMSSGAPSSTFTTYSMANLPASVTGWSTVIPYKLFAPKIKSSNVAICSKILRSNKQAKHTSRQKCSTARNNASTACLRLVTVNTVSDDVDLRERQESPQIEEPKDSSQNITLEGLPIGLTLPLVIKKVVYARFNQDQAPQYFEFIEQRVWENIGDQELDMKRKDLFHINAPEVEMSFRAGERQMIRQWKGIMAYRYGLARFAH
jgi:hypothetical protein